MRNFQKLMAVIALSGMCLAAGAPSDTEAAKKTTKKTAAAAKKDETADQLRALKEMVEQQQAAMQQVQQQLQQTQQQLQQTQQQLNQTQQTAKEAEAKAVTVENNSTLKVQKVQTDLSDVKTALSATTETAKQAEKAVGDLEHPNTIAYKGVRITPAGFVEASGYFRSRATVSDLGTPFGSIPLNTYAPGSTLLSAFGVANPNTEPQGYNPNLTEFGISARNSRLAVRLDTDAGKTKLASYVEMDFFGTSPTANPNQTTSYPPRLRQAWGRAKFDNGWTITGGQMWSLITLNRKGTDADNSALWIPNSIETSYSIGFDWGRFGEFRINKAIGSKTNFAIGITNPSGLTTVNNSSSTNVAGVASTGTGNDGNSLASSCTVSNNAAAGAAPNYIVNCPDSPTYSTNLAPDVIAKLAVDDPKFGHYELKGVVRFFRDRQIPQPANTTTTPATPAVPGVNNMKIGAGFGAGGVVPLVAKKADFIFQGLYGKGVSRYESSSQSDYIVRNAAYGDNNIQLIESFSALAGIETHPTPKTEFDIIGGDEYYFRSTYSNPTNATQISGWGTPTADNRGCYYETAALAASALGLASGKSAACTGTNKNLYNFKLIGYYDAVKGPKGTLRFGAEYDYDYRSTWSGNGGLAAGTPGLAPHGYDNIVFTTMRYIFP